MRGYQEYRGRSIRLVYDRECGEFVYRVEPHPFLVRTSEAKVRSDARGCDSKAPSGKSAPAEMRAEKEKSGRKAGPASLGSDGRQLSRISAGRRPYFAATSNPGHAEW